MGFRDVAFLSGQASFPNTFPINGVGAKAWRPQHVLNLSLLVSNGMLHGNYFGSNKASLCQLNLMEIIKLS